MLRLSFEECKDLEEIKLIIKEFEKFTAYIQKEEDIDDISFYVDVTFIDKETNFKYKHRMISNHTHLDNPNLNYIFQLKFSNAFDDRVIAFRRKLEEFKEKKAN